MLLNEIASANALMTDNEKFLLALSASSLPAGSTVVEIGAFLGGSTEIMLKAAGDRIQLHSIDIVDKVPDTLKAEHSNFTMYEEPAGEFAARESMDIDMLFVDGGHSFFSVREDVLNFWDMVRNGGLIVFHDALHPVELHIGVRIYVESLLANGNIVRPVRADSMVAAYVDKSVPLPSAETCAEVAHKLIYLPQRSRNWVCDAVDSGGFLSHSHVSLPDKSKPFALVGGGKRGQFVARFIGVSSDLLINSKEASEAEIPHFVCSDYFDEIFTHFVWHTRIPPRNIFNVSPLTLSFWLLDDILNNGGKRLVRVFERKEERDVIEALLARLSAQEVLMMHETGLLHDLFVCFPAEFPPEK